jgi:hypothetical protein
MDEVQDSAHAGVGVDAAPPNVEAGPDDLAVVRAEDASPVLTEAAAVASDAPAPDVAEDLGAPDALAGASSAAGGGGAVPADEDAGSVHNAVPDAPVDLPEPSDLGVAPAVPVQEEAEAPGLGTRDDRGERSGPRSPPVTTGGAVEVAQVAQVAERAPSPLSRLAAAAAVLSPPPAGPLSTWGSPESARTRPGRLRLTADDVPTLPNINLRLHVPPVGFAAGQADGIAGALRDLDGASHPSQRTTVVDGEEVAFFLLAQLPPFYQSDAHAAEHLLASLQISVDIVPLTAGPSADAAGGSAGAGGAATAMAVAAAAATASMLGRGPPGGRRRSTVAVDTRESHHDPLVAGRTAPIALMVGTTTTAVAATAVYALRNNWVAYPLRARIGACVRST